MTEDKLSLTSQDVLTDRISVLNELFPEVFVEGKVNFERLKLALGESVDEGRERYGLSWAGKSEALRNLQSQSVGTLKPAPEESVNFETTENLFIEGDNLEVLKLLQKSYHNQIKMIYIDPPYNTGKEFIYPDNFREGLEDYLRFSGQKNGEGIKLTTKTETSGRIHSNWLNMIYPRLFLARNLLKDDGVIFVSIDDNEIANLRLLMNEIFGAENFIGIFPWRKRTAKSDVPFGVSQDYEWILIYTRGGFGAGIGYERKYYQSDDFPNDRWRLSDLTTQRSATERPNSAFNLVDPKTGKTYRFNPKRVWGITRETFPEYYDKGKVVFPDDYDFLNIKIPAYRVFESEDKEKSLKKYGTEDAMKAVSTHLPKVVGMSEDGNKEIVNLFGGKIFSFPKPKELIKYFLAIANDRNDSLVLDFFSGSCTTAHAVLEQNQEDGGNRKFIMVQLPEPCDENSEAFKAGYRNIADIGKERIRRAINKINQEENGKLNLNGSTQDRGFKVFKLTESNFKIWDGSLPKNVEQLQLLLKEFTDNIMPGSTKLGMLYEIMLKAGFSLTAKVEKLEIADQEIYAIENKQLFLCLEDEILEATVKQILTHKPKQFISLDASFRGNDQLKTNTQLQMRDHDIKFRTV